VGLPFGTKHGLRKILLRSSIHFHPSDLQIIRRIRINLKVMKDETVQHEESVFNTETDSDNVQRTMKSAHHIRRKAVIMAIDVPATSDLSR
jgi:hypothetical protein